MLKNYKQSCTIYSTTDVMAIPETLQAQGAVLHLLLKTVNGFSQLYSSSTEEPFNQHGTARHIKIHINDFPEQASYPNGWKNKLVETPSEWPC